MSAERDEDYDLPLRADELNETQHDDYELPLQADELNETQHDDYEPLQADELNETQHNEYDLPLRADELNETQHDDYELPLQADEIYETPFDVVNNTSYGNIRKLDVVGNTIATGAPASSYHVTNTEKSKKEVPPMTKQCGAVLTCLVAFLIIALMIVASIALITFVQISNLRSDVVLQSTSPGMETTLANNLTTTLVIQAVESIMDTQFSELNDRLNAVIGSVLDSAANLTRLDNEANNRLENISDSLSIPLSFINLVISKTTAGNTNSLEAFFVDILNETENAFSSCAAIHQRSPSSPSGYYHIKSSNGSAVRVYCDMTKSCGNITGGWMRVADLDMTDNTTQCPNSLELRTSTRRICRTRNSSSALCSSDTFPVGGVRYSKVCGRIRAYQFGTLNAFGNANLAVCSRNTSHPNIETYYVDGVSLTHGTSPRQHIWTFAGADSEDGQNPTYSCPCINTNISSRVPPPPSFVGEDYFCDTAAISGGALIFHTDNPLWDGAGCGPRNTCCSFNTPPWFYKQLLQATTDDIEMRVCRDQGRADEDIAIEVVEIYVQ